jgi:hypothetical protein
MLIDLRVFILRDAADRYKRLSVKTVFSSRIGDYEQRAALLNELADWLERDEITLPPGAMSTRSELTEGEMVNQNQEGK